MIPPRVVRRRGQRCGPLAPGVEPRPAGTNLDLNQIGVHYMARVAAMKSVGPFGGAYQSPDYEGGGSRMPLTKNCP